jgi:hypothetical protein
MFCDRCGATVQRDQRFCGQCGKQFSIEPYRFPNRVQEHVRLLGILWLALSTLNAVIGLALCIIANTVFAHLHELGGPPNAPAGFIRSLLCAFGSLILIKAACGFFAGWGLLRREPWARTLTIVVSFLALFHIPFGTALGIYSMWVLLPAQSEREYEQASRAGAV